MRAPCRYSIVPFLTSFCSMYKCMINLNRHLYFPGTYYLDSFDLSIHNFMEKKMAYKWHITYTATLSRKSHTPRAFRPERYFQLSYKQGYSFFSGVLNCVHELQSRFSQTTRNTRMPIEFFTTLNKKNFRQKLPPMGFELTTSGSSVPCSANCAREESVGDFWSELSFVSCTTSHAGLCLFLESIEHDFIKALMIHTHNQIVT